MAGEPDRVGRRVRGALAVPQLRGPGVLTVASQVKRLRTTTSVF
jgi:hypothetical protein